MTSLPWSRGPIACGLLILLACLPAALSGQGPDTERTAWRAARTFLGSAAGLAIGAAAGAGAVHLIAPDRNDELDLPSMVVPLAGGSVGAGFGAHLGGSGEGNAALASLAAFGIGSLAISGTSPADLRSVALRVALPMALTATVVALLTDP